MSDARRWAWRGALAAGLGVALWVAAAATDLQPHPVPLLLLTALVVAVSGLVTDSLTTTGQAGWVPHTPVDPRTRARDARTSSHLHLLQTHVHGKQADVDLPRRLAELAEDRLQARHALSADSSRGRELLGPLLAQLADGAPRRLSVAEIDQCMNRIEAL